MEKRSYSEEFKEAMVKKVLTRGEKTIQQIVEEVGIAPSVLARWKRERTMSATGSEKKEMGRRPQDWMAEEKLEAVLETQKLSPEDLGIYLRRKGLHSVHLEQWKREILEALKGEGNSKRKNGEILEVKKKNQELERELRRKEKALAEASALLILKKKAALIWGGDEEEKWE